MSHRSVRVAAQAKLNLHLRVLAREESGFHSLETIFHRIDLADDLVVSAATKGRELRVIGDDAGPLESNLAYRAAAAYSAHAGWPHGFSIELTKRIPIGAGLGGGSADAAAVLRALNFLSPDPIPQPGLLRMAASLGSDVPFLATDAVMALAWGRGERMLRCAPLPRQDILLMTPEFRVSTADAYRWLDEDRVRSRSAEPEDANETSDAGEAEHSVEAMLLDPVSLTTWSSIARFARNDFEAPVAARHPALSGYLAQLRASRAMFAQMTGSGSTLFGVLDTPSHYARLPEEHRRNVLTTRTSIDVVQPVGAD